MDVIQRTIKEIKTLKIQGATNVALASLDALSKDFGEKRYKDIGILNEKIKKLKKLRPTEPLLFNSLDYIYSQLECSNDLNHLNKIIDKLIRRIGEIQEEITKNGVELIRNGMNVFSHCHSTTVVEILKQAQKSRKKFQVFLSETRPLYQGRMTAQALVRAGVKATMVVDAAAPYIISQEDEIPINLVLLGCDAISPEKGVFNKIGSYGLALSAYEAKIPVFVAGTLLKTFKGEVEIEKRKVKEIWEGKPWNLKIINLAFDFIPSQLITGIISEFGILKPAEISKMVTQNYPFILK